MKEFHLGDPFSPTPESFHLRLVETLEELKEEPMKRRHKIGTTILVAAAILTLLIGTALAAGYFSGEIDWTGRKISENPPQEPFATPTPAPPGAEGAEARSEYEHSILKNQPEGEYWQIRWEDSGTSQGCQKAFTSLDELNEFLGEGVTPFLLLTEVPDGFTFENAHCMFYFTADILDRATVETQALAEGSTLTKVVPGADIYALTCEYVVGFRRADGSYLSIWASLSSVDIDDYGIGVNGDESYEVLNLHGMEHALFIGSDDHRHIAAIAQIPEIEGYVYPDQYWNGIPPDTFSHVDYTFDTDNMTKDELIAVVQSMR